MQIKSNFPLLDRMCKEGLFGYNNKYYLAIPSKKNEIIKVLTKEHDDHIYCSEQFYTDGSGYKGRTYKEKADEVEEIILHIQNGFNDFKTI